MGQLAADLIISTLDMVRVGHFHTDCLIPMAGNNPYSSGEEDAALLSTNAEGQITSLTNSRDVREVTGPVFPGDSRKWTGIEYSGISWNAVELKIKQNEMK